MSNLKRKIGMVEVLIFLKSIHLFSLTSKRETKKNEEKIKISTSAHESATERRRNYLFNNKDRI
jgi:hypothetical protein